MAEIKTEFLFTIDLDFEIFVLGETPYGVRRIARLNSGSFAGPRIKGTVLPGGGSWSLVRHVDAVAVTEDGEFAASFKAIAALALKNKLPSIGSKEYAEAGGLIGYGVNILDLYRRAAYFIDKILKGAKPAELPIEQPTRFEFVINLNTARTLGLNIPPMLLTRADKVIE